MHLTECAPLKNRRRVRNSLGKDVVIFVQSKELNKPEVTHWFHYVDPVAVARSDWEH